MSNDAMGKLKVVAKDKATLERIKKILDYKDNKYCLYRCKSVYDCGEYKEGDYWVKLFEVDGAWTCGPFFTYGNHPSRHLQGYKDLHTLETIDKPAHFTDLCYLAKTLDFGCELFASEFGMEFCEHYITDHNGDLIVAEKDTAKLVYEEDENGEPNYDSDPDEEYGMEGFMEFGNADEIYGLE